MIVFCCMVLFWLLYCFMFALVYCFIVSLLFKLFDCVTVSLVYCYSVFVLNVVLHDCFIAISLYGSFLVAVVFIAVWCISCLMYCVVLWHLLFCCSTVSLNYLYGYMVLLMVWLLYCFIVSLFDWCIALLFSLIYCHSVLLFYCYIVFIVL